MEKWLGTQNQEGTTHVRTSKEESYIESHTQKLAFECLVYFFISFFGEDYSGDNLLSRSTKCNKTYSTFSSVLNFSFKRCIIYSHIRFAVTFLVPTRRRRLGWVGFGSVYYSSRTIICLYGAAFSNGQSNFFCTNK